MSSFFQTIKQKLHINKRGAAVDAMMAEVKQEEDKAKMLLGAKLLVGERYEWN